MSKGSQLSKKLVKCHVEELKKVRDSIGLIKNYRRSASLRIAYLESSSEAYKHDLEKLGTQNYSLKKCLMVCRKFEKDTLELKELELMLVRLDILDAGLSKELSRLKRNDHALKKALIPVFKDATEAELSRLKAECDRKLTLIKALSAYKVATEHHLKVVELEQKPVCLPSGVVDAGSHEIHLTSNDVLWLNAAPTHADDMASVINEAASKDLINSREYAEVMSLVKEYGLCLIPYLKTESRHQKLNKRIGKMVRRFKKGRYGMSDVLSKDLSKIGDRLNIE